MLITIREIIDIIIMTAAVGYIFVDIFKLTKHHYGFDWDSFFFACIITAPALIFHELAHKFVALGFGLEATFHAAYGWLGIGLAMKLLNTGFIFFVPGYVSITCAQMPCMIQPLHSALVAFAGPFLNLVLFAVSKTILSTNKKLSRRTMAVLIMTQRINLFLFIFNMLPIPGFDGLKVYSGLYSFFSP